MCIRDRVKSIVAIHYSWKKWKPDIEIEILDNNASYELIIYALFLMRQKQQAESAGSTMMVGG